MAFLRFLLYAQSVFSRPNLNMVRAIDVIGIFKRLPSVSSFFRSSMETWRNILDGFERSNVPLVGDFLIGYDLTVVFCIHRNTESLTNDKVLNKNKPRLLSVDS